MVELWILAILSAANVSAAEPLGDCEGSPESAVTELPGPMKEFAVLVCTPYGHVISNREGWIWTNPGAFSPVMIPSQMVRSNPAELGNSSYFASIDFSAVDGSEAQVALDALSEGFDDAGSSSDVYRLIVQNQDGKTLKFYFSFDRENSSYWGIWCDGECQSNTRFMMLDMRE